MEYTQYTPTRIYMCFWTGASALTRRDSTLVIPFSFGAAFVRRFCWILLFFIFSLTLLLFFSLSLNKLGENVLTRSYSLSQIFIYAEFDPKKGSSRALDLNIKYFFYLKFLSKKPKRNCEKTVEEIKIVATCSRKKRIKLAKARLFSD